MEFVTLSAGLAADLPDLAGQPGQITVSLSAALSKGREHEEVAWRWPRFD